MQTQIQQTGIRMISIPFSKYEELLGKAEEYDRYNVVLSQLADIQEEYTNGDYEKFSNADDLIANLKKL